MLSFPPHCTHRLQPLDRSVFGPFKKYINTEITQWLTNNPGSTFSIYDIPSIVAKAFPLAFTPVNIQAGFKSCGISPFNRNIFGEHEFLGSFVTDRPAPAEMESVIAPQPNDEVHSMTSTLNANAPGTLPAVEQQNINISHPGSSGLLSSPFSVRPLPKAPARKSLKKNNRRKGRSMVLTDTPEKMEIEEMKNMQQLKNVKKKVLADKKKIKKQTNSKAKDNAEMEEENEEDFCLVCLNPYSESRSREVWVQCLRCKFWSHEACTPGFPTYLCHNKNHRHFTNQVEA